MSKALLLLGLLLFSGCTSSQLSPARELEGTWQTPFPVTFFIKTDFINMELEDVGSEDRMMTWIITKGSNDNTVDVEVSFTTSNRTLTPGSGYTPDIPLMSLVGTISGTELTLSTSNGRVIGTFSFTTDLMMGTWVDSWELAYAQEVYTKTNELKLERQ